MIKDQLFALEEQGLFVSRFWCEQCGGVSPESEEACLHNEIVFVRMEVVFTALFLGLVW